MYSCLIKDTDNNIFDSSEQIITLEDMINALLGAFYLKYYNRYKTIDKISIEYINDIIEKACNGENIVDDNIDMYIINFNHYLLNVY